MQQKLLQYEPLDQPLNIRLVLKAESKQHMVSQLICRVILDALF